MTLGDTPAPPRPTDVLPVPRDRLLHDWAEAHGRALRYLAAFDLSDVERARLAARAMERALTAPPWAPGASACSETMQALRELLVETNGSSSDAPASGPPFLAWRLRRLLGSEAAATGTPPTMPPVTRASMWAHRLEVRGHRRRIVRAPLPEGAPQRAAADPFDLDRSDRPWLRSARRRRRLLALLVLLPTIVATGFMTEVLPHQGGTWLEVAIALVFGLLFGWISIGFWTALIGFGLLVGRDRFAITNTIADPPTPIAPEARTAIVMPICEEPVARTFAGLRAVYRSLERTGALDRFDFFVLSDTGSPNTWIDEEEAWLCWCRATSGFGRIFYRRRKARVARKSGNVADFCRRWGRQYRYMIMLDADSIMSGTALVRLVGMMEATPRVGMIQTAPATVNQRSLFARAQQFASRVYGPMFAAGLHFWQLGEGQYWGHNAIIRIDPFMEHCGLPALPGSGPLAGEILSHDFVEAALMGRVGWELWLAFDLGGSYEESPSSLLEEMRRDQRWCQGNLQHLGLLFTEGLFGAHRALFLNGVLSYVSAFLWLCFLVLSTTEVAIEALREPDYFPHGASLFPEWPVWRPDWAIALVAVTAAILFLPKVLGLVLIVAKRRNALAFGGTVRLTASVLLEMVLGSLFAPIRMVFHSRFVVTNALGRRIVWRSQTRGDAETSWAEALRHHGLDTVVATVWGGTVYWLNPQYFWWLTPILAALVLSIPLSIVVSRARWGERARAAGLFLIPEETDPPPELRDLWAGLAEAASRPDEDGFVRTVRNPEANALHRGLQRAPRPLAASIRAARRRLVERALRAGPSALSRSDRRVVLLDPDATDALHTGVWALPEERFVAWLPPAAATSDPAADDSAAARP